MIAGEWDADSLSVLICLLSPVSNGVILPLSISVNRKHNYQCQPKQDDVFCLRLLHFGIPFMRHRICAQTLTVKVSRQDLHVPSCKDLLLSLYLRKEPADQQKLYVS